MVVSVVVPVAVVAAVVPAVAAVAVVVVMLVMMVVGEKWVGTTDLSAFETCTCCPNTYNVNQVVVRYLAQVKACLARMSCV